MWEGVRWLRAAQHNGSRPWFVYQGMVIVHPPYVTNEYWYEQIQPS